MIPFGEFLPDQSDLENPGLTRCENCLPVGGKYIGFPSPAAVSTDALDSKPMGRISFIGRNKVSRHYVGTSTKLYGLEGLTHADYSNGTYSTQGEEGWDFVKYDQLEKEYVIASNGSDLIQYIEVGDTSFQPIATAPRSRHIGVIKGTLVCAAQEGNSLIVDWGPVGDPFGTWPDPGTLEADAVKRGRQVLNNNGGPIKGVVSGDVGFILQENAITRMQFVGGSVHFQITGVADVEGVISQNGWVKKGDQVYYLSREGIQVFDGARSTPLGHGKVDSYLLDDLDDSYLYRVEMARHPEYPILIINYPSSSATDGNPDSQIIFNTVTGMWSTGTNTVTTLFSAFGRGQTGDSLTGTIDSQTQIGDSTVLNRGNPVLSGYNSTHYLVDFTGSALASVIETSEYVDQEDRITNILGVRPAIEATSVTAQVGTRNVQTGAESWSTAVSVASSGLSDSRESGRYFRFRFNITGLTKAAGFTPTLVPGGFQ